MTHGGFEAEMPDPVEFFPTIELSTQSVQPVTSAARVEDLSNINVFPAGHTALDLEIHGFHTWAERQLAQPGQAYLQQTAFLPVTSADAKRAEENQQAIALYKNTFDTFFWTGIECSNPHSPDGERWDQLDYTHFYDPAHRQAQLKQMADLNIKNVRLGMPNHLLKTELDWEGFTTIIREFKAEDIKISLDLQHFGLPDEYRNADNREASLYLNPEWPTYYAQFAMDTVKRYLPDLDAITLINEPLITNRFSGVLWNEALPGSYTDPMFDHYFIRRAILIAKAALQARVQIEDYLQSQPEDGKRRITFIHNESCEYQPDDYQFNEFNRFLASDLILGQEWLFAEDVQKTDMFKWMARQSVRQEWLTEDIASLIADIEAIRALHHAFETRFGKTMKADTVFGIDYYIGCETVKPTNTFALTKTDVTAYPQEVVANQRRGLARICMEYWNRYQLPILHTETNFFDHGSEDWGTKQLVELAQLPKFGIPILGFNWYSLMDQFNWDTALSGSPTELRLHPVGLVRYPDYGLRHFSATVLPDLMAALKSHLAKPEATTISAIG